LSSTSTIKNLLAKFYFKLIFTISPPEELKYKILTKEDRKLLELSSASYLEEIGWIRSAIEKEIVDAEGKPIPWMTYPFLHFIHGRLDPKFSVFEYGSGKSTLYFAKYVKEVIAVEHDLEWYNHLKDQLPENVRLTYEELKPGGLYSKKSLTTGEKYDLVIIDGRDRVNCCYSAPKALKEDGIIVFDNSDRASYKIGVDFLLDQGYKRIDFWGMAPKSPQLTCTSVFYRRDNCLNI
jgi:hypothetical protein